MSLHTLQLYSFAILCDIPICWVERDKEDYPNDCETMVNKVFYAWWGRSTLSIGKKILYIQAAFVAEGKPAVFDRIILKYPDLKMLLEYARSDVVPAIPSGNGATSPNVRPSYDNSTLPSHGYVETGQVSAEEYDVICLLSAVIWNEPDYVSICDSLGVPLEYGPHGKPKYSTWMLQTEATLMRFYAESKGFLFKMAHVRTAFNACSYLMFCDETLVSMGYENFSYK